MRTIHKYTVVPTLPDRLAPLGEIARNLWWTWNPEAIELFRRIDSDLWEGTGRNPVRLLREVEQDRLVRLMANEAFLAHMDRVNAELRRYLEHSTWYAWVHGTEVTNNVAYFSLEFGIHECLPIYSGGLGVLAGDHLKSASELGVPLTGVGLLYRNGYFRQSLGPDGWQQEAYQRLDFDALPVTRVFVEGEPLVVTVRLPGRDVMAQVWKVEVGRVTLLLLDCDVDGNGPEDRGITAQLYGGDLDMRIRQEIVVGVGGIRALRSLGIPPTVCHMNEGHSAFLALERIRDLMEENGLGFEDAREVVMASNVFTTHTPVPAGNDVFPAYLVREYFEDYSKELGLSVDTLLGLGQVPPETGRDSPFAMPALALRLSGYANGVSKLHGKVSRKMWATLYPDLTEAEIPITHITNGIHTRSWLSDEFARLYDRYLGPRWLEDPMDQGLWERVDQIPDAEIWRARERLRERLVAFARLRLKRQLERRGLHRMRVLEAEEVLDPEALTIGFARRFAAYKRAFLILSAPDRLSRLLNDKDRPVQIIFAGKAHPRDKQGKELIRELVELASVEEFRRKIVFLEDYDLNVARHLVQGVDVWLNTPRRPLEASGTSGMKVPVNGGLNLSIVDGWWAEGYMGENGWAIGRGEEYEDHEYADEIEARALYGLVEREVIPLFYSRGADGLPHDWIEMMKASIRTVCPVFNTNRMVREYLEQFYLPAAMHWRFLTAEEGKEARSLVAWRALVRREWPGLRILSVEAAEGKEVPVGGGLPVEVKVRLGDLSPKDVSVELFHGPLDDGGAITEGQVVCMSHRSESDGVHRFVGELPCTRSGSHAFTVRVLPWRSVLGRMLHTGPMTTA